MLARISAEADRLVGLAGLSPHQIGRVRAEQIRAILRLTPAMMLGNFASVVAILFQTSGSDRIRFIALWAICVIALTVMGLNAWHVSRRSPIRASASDRGAMHAMWKAAMLGACWAVLPGIASTISDPMGMVLISSIVAGIMCGAGFALSPLPQAALAFMAPLGLGAVVTAATMPSANSIALSLMLGLYAIVIGFSTLGYARIFAARLIAEIEAHEQKSVVDLLLKSFEDNAADWLWQIDVDGCLRRVSPRFGEVMGKTSVEIEGQNLLALIVGKPSQDAGRGALAEAIANRAPFRDIEIQVSCRGELRWWRLTGEPLADEFGSFAGFRGVGADVTDTKVARSKIEFLAHRDSLTGAFNRVRFNEIVSEKFLAARDSARHFALVFLDLDRFKAVNDTHGHGVGDDLLRRTIERIRWVMPDNEFIARLGGDEFGIIIENAETEEDVTKVADILLKAFSQPFEIGAEPVIVGASLGIAMSHGNAPSADKLFDNADLALSRARRDGGMCCRFFSPDMDSEIREARAFELDLEQAVQRHELELHFQPIVRATDGGIASFEALVRWRNPSRGLVSPLVFIPVAERTGAIMAIGEWVLKEACRIASDWPGDIVVSVNLSARQFAEGSVVELVREALDVSGLPAVRLEVEITESVLIEHPVKIRQALEALRALGVRLAMDDFGTGYSSLAYLWQFPFDKIKIDGSFVAAIDGDAGARKVLHTIAALAKSLGMKLTAERVETESEARYLREIACDFLQGYHFSRPLPPSELAPILLREHVLRIDARNSAGRHEHRRTRSA